MPTTSSPDLTEARPSSQDDSTTVPGVCAAGRCRSRTTDRRRGRRGEERVVAGVPAVAGEVQDVDLVRQRGDRAATHGPRSTVALGQSAAARVTSSSARSTSGPATRPTRGSAGVAGQAELQPTGRRGRDGDRSSFQAGQQGPRGAASKPEGVSTMRRSPTSGEQRGDDLFGNHPKAFVQRTADRGRERTGELRGRHVEVRGDASRSLRTGAAAQVDRVHAVAGHDDSSQPAVDGEVRDQAASVAASSPWTSSSAAGSPTWPPPSPYQLCSRMWSGTRRVAEVGGVRGRIGGVQHPQLGELGGQLFVGRRAHGRTRETSAGPARTTRRPARATPLEGQPQTLQRQGASVSDEGALEVEAAEGRLPGVQLGEALPHLGPRGVGRPDVVVQLGAHLVQQQPGLDRGVLVDDDTVEAGARVGCVSPVQGRRAVCSSTSVGVAG